MAAPLHILVPAVPVADLNRIGQALAATWPEARIQSRPDGEPGVAIYLGSAPKDESR